MLPKKEFDVGSEIYHLESGAYHAPSPMVSKKAAFSGQKNENNIFLNLYEDL